MKRITKTLVLCIVAVLIVCGMTVVVSAANPATYAISVPSRLDGVDCTEDVFNAVYGFDANSGKDEAAINAWAAEYAASEATAGKWSLENGGDDTVLIRSNPSGTGITNAEKFLPAVIAVPYNEGVELVYTFAEDETVTADTYNFATIIYKNANADINTFTLVTDAGEYIYEFEGQGLSGMFSVERADIVLYNGDVEGNFPSADETLVAIKFGFAIGEGSMAGLFGFGLFQSEGSYSAFPAAYVPDPVWPDYYSYENMVTNPDATIAIINSVKANATTNGVLDSLTSWIAANKKKENIVLAGEMGTVVEAAYYSNYWRGGKDRPEALLKWSDIDGHDEMPSYKSTDLINHSLADKHISDVISSLATSLTKLSDAGIPYFVTGGADDNMGGQYKANVLFDKASTTLDCGCVIDFKGVGHEANRVSATYTGDNLTTVAQSIKMGRKGFLVITLPGLPSTAEVSWANNLIRSNTDKKVILIVGRMMDSKGIFYNWYDTEVGETAPTEAEGRARAAANGRTYSIFENRNIRGGVVDGNVIFNRLAASNDNVFLIIDGGSTSDGSMETLSNELVHVTMPNNYGEDVHIVQSNFSNLLRADAGAILLAKIHDEASKVSLFVYSPQKTGYLAADKGGYVTIDVPALDTTGRTLKTAYTANDIDWNAEKITFDANQYKWMSALTLANLKYKAGEKEIEIAGNGYTLNFKAANITYPGVNGYYTFVASVNGAAVYDKDYSAIKDLAGTSLVKALTFAQDGGFPFTGAKITLDVGKVLNNRTLTLARYDSTTNEFEKLEEAVVVDGSITFSNVGGTLVILK